MNKNLLWLDDYRNPFDKDVDWLIFSPIGRNVDIVWVKSYYEFTEWIIKNGLPDGICFDHDLGDIVYLEARANKITKNKAKELKKQEKTGYDCAKWLIEYCYDNKKKIPNWNVHSANPVGKININQLLEKFNSNSKF